MKNFTLEETRKLITFGEVVMAIGVLITFVLGFCALQCMPDNVTGAVAIVIVIVLNLVLVNGIHRFANVFALHAENVYAIRKTICKEEDSDNTENTEEKLSDEEIEAILEKENS